MQKPLPIWVGGEAGPSLRRAARVGDAWYPIGSNNKHLLDTLPRLKAGIGRLRKAVAEAGRAPGAVGVAFRVKRYGAAVPPKATDGERRLFSGSEADIIADFRALAGARRHGDRRRFRRTAGCGGDAGGDEAVQGRGDREDLKHLQHGVELLDRLIVPARVVVNEFNVSIDGA